jgi:hypothetical protein
MDRNPLANDPAHEQRVRERAYHLWETDGKPFGHDIEYWERARALVGMEESAGSGLVPENEMSPDSPRVTGIEEAQLQENLGEFPGQLTDQGDSKPTPAIRKRARARAKTS